MGGSKRYIVSPPQCCLNSPATISLSSNFMGFIKHCHVTGLWFSFSGGCFFSSFAALFLLIIQQIISTFHKFWLNHCDLELFFINSFPWLTCLLCPLLFFTQAFFAFPSWHHLSWCCPPSSMVFISRFPPEISFLLEKQQIHWHLKPSFAVTDSPSTTHNSGFAGFYIVSFEDNGWLVF